MFLKGNLNCQALVQVQSSPVQVEGLGLSLWSLLPTTTTTTTTTTANFEKIKWILYSIKSQKILSYIIIPTAHHHHHHSKLFKLGKK